MANRFVFDGMAELKAALRQLPEELRGDASDIATATARATVVELRAAYGKHNKSGNLQRGVVLSRVDKGKFTAGVIVKSTAPHAHLFEYGTQARHNSLGANRGSMPPNPTFVPIAQRRRAAMFELLKVMLTSKGFLVSGNAG